MSPRRTSPQTWPGGRKAASVQAIQHEVCRQWNVEIAQLRGDQRRRDLVAARHMAMYLCTVMTPYSLPAIGGFFGDRDHSTVVHAADKMRRLIDTDPAVAAMVAEIAARVPEAAAPPAEELAAAEAGLLETLRLAQDMARGAAPRNSITGTGRAVADHFIRALIALAQIAEGAPDPRALAREVLALPPAADADTGPEVQTGAKRQTNSEGDAPCAADALSG